jgi:outer membrane protein assembly factor BamA
MRRNLQLFFGLAAVCFALLGSCAAQTLVGKIAVTDDETGLADSTREVLAPLVGTPYSAQTDETLRTKAEQELAAHGYLEATAAVTHDNASPVNVMVTMTPGRQYRISSISAGGGPLLPGRDFSPGFSSKPGDIAGAGAFGHVPSDLRTYYWRNGYADVETHVSTQLDMKQGTAAYRLDVSPGQLYHVRSVTLQNLSADQESKVRGWLGLKPGDVFDQTAVTGLYRKLPTEPSLASYTFTSTPKEDKAAAAVDLVLDFHKKQPGGVIFR